MGDAQLPDYWSEPGLPTRQRNYYRSCFSGLSSEQKRVAFHLVRETALTTIFSFLVTLDQMPFGDCQMFLRPDDKAVSDVPMLPDPQSFDLHDELLDWVASFSEFADELVTVIPQELCWRIEHKYPY